MAQELQAMQLACTGNMLHHQLEVKSLDGGKVEW